MLSATVILTLLPLVQASPLARRDLNVQIHPNGDTSQCLQFLAGSHGPRAPDQIFNDAPLSVGACDSIYVYNRFDISYGDQQGIKLSGSNLCIDAGIGPHSGGPAKLYQCLGVPQQRWYYTADNHIAITGGDQCLDRQDGGFNVQTWQCFGNNPNQVWTIGSGGGIPTPPPPPPPPSVSGTVLHVNGDQSRCLTIQPDQGAVAGAEVNVANCAADSSLPGTYQRWDLSRGSTEIRPHNYDTSLCLDLGSDTSGSRVKLQKCNGSASQKLYWTGVGDDHIAWEGGRTCLDAALNSANSAGPYPYLARAQAWQCFSPNAQQVWN